MFTGDDISTGLGSLLLTQLPAMERSRTFQRVVVDSRKVEPGDIFVALAGEHTDGHQFIGDALASGAKGILAKAWPPGLSATETQHATLFQVADPLLGLQTLAAAHRTRLGVRVISVTGSVGKTSTKDAIATVLAQRFRILKSDGNLNTEIGLPLVLLNLLPEHQRAVLEMGMYNRGDIARLCQIAQPTVGVITNIGPSHMERLGSIERIADAKAELVESLPRDGIAVLNSDDLRVAELAQRTCARVVTYGQSPRAMCRAEALESRGLEGISFRLHWQDQSSIVHTPLLGRHSVYTALAAAAVGHVEGLAPEEIATGLEGLQDVNRIRVRRTPQGATVLDDTYNASPVSVKAALALLSEMPGKKIAVLGDMLELGDSEKEGHREVGRAAAKTVDQLVTIGPRASDIAEAACQQGLTAVLHFDTKEQAAEALSGVLTKDAYVLVKGSRGIALEDLVAALCMV